MTSVSSKWDGGSGHQCRFGEIVKVNPSYDVPDRDEYLFLEMNGVSTDKPAPDYFLTRPRKDCTSVTFGAGDTLFARITPSTENGKVAFIQDLEDEIAFGSTELIVLSPRQRKVMPKYVYHLAKSERVRNMAVSMMEGSTARQRVPKEAFETAIRVWLPPRAEQRRITVVLDSVDRAIEKTDEVIEKTEKLKQGLGQNLFTKGVGHDRFGTVRIGPREINIPTAWDVTTLSEITTGQPQYGANEAAREFHSQWPRYVRITDSDDRGFLLPWGRKSLPPELATRYMLDQGDLLFVRSGQSSGDTYLYRTTDGDCAFAGYLIRFAVDSTICLPEYLFYYTRSGLYQGWVKSMLKRATTQPNINALEYSSLPIPLPSLEEQAEIGGILSLVDSRIRAEERYRGLLHTVRKGLTQDLLTGKVCFQGVR